MQYCGIEVDNKRNKILSETPQKLSGKNSSIPPMIDILIENFEQIAEKQFKLSPYVEHYPSSSKVVISQLRLIVNMIKEIKKTKFKNFFQSLQYQKRHRFIN